MPPSLNRLHHLDEFQKGLERLVEEGGGVLLDLDQSLVKVGVDSIRPLLNLTRFQRMEEDQEVISIHSLLLLDRLQYPSHLLRRVLQLRIR